MGLIHDDVVVNTDAMCEIDISTRKITNKSSKTQMLQYDHNSERIGFTMNRYNDGHDMSKVDRIAIKYLNVRNSDMYIVDDLSLSDDGQTITFSWLVSGNATQEVGSLAFLINFRCYDDYGTITYNWSTLPSSTYSILKGVTSMDSFPNEQYDFWARYETLVNTVISNTTKVGDQLAVVTDDANELEEVVGELTKNSSAMTTKVNKLTTDVPALESRVSIIKRELPDLESRVDSLNRTLEDDPIHAVSEEVGEIKTSLVNQGRVNYDLLYKTSVGGNLGDDDSGYRLITSVLLDCSEKIRVTNTSDKYQFGIIYYEEDKSWSNADPGWMKAKEYHLREYGYAYVNFKKTDGSVFTDDDIRSIKENIIISKTNLEFAKDTDLTKAERLIEPLTEHYDFNEFVLEVGTISAGKIELGSPARCCTVEYIRVRKGMWVTMESSDYYFGVACFDKNKIFDGADHGWMQNDFLIDFDGYILINFRRSDNANVSESDKVAIKAYCSVKDHIKYSDDFVNDINSMINVPTSNERAMSSILVEYGRHDGASYVFCRIPKTLNDGRTILPKVKLTSEDGEVSGSKRSTLTYACDNNCVFTMNAGLFNTTTMEPVGQTIIDGVSITNTPMTDDNGSPISDTECYPLCVDANGLLSAPYSRDIDTSVMISDGIIQAITGWGKIVENFEIALDDINAEIVHRGKYIRQSIGQYQNGDYAVCTVDMTRGSIENEAGITYEALAQIFVDHGVKFAYSLDGGGSAQTVIGKRQLNPIYEGTVGRKVPTVISFEIAD